MSVLYKRTKILMALFIFSCSAEIPNPNKNFVTKYQTEVLAINEQRVLKKGEEKEMISSQPPTEQEVTESLAKKAEYYPYVRTNRIGDTPLQMNLPNREIYQQIAGSGNKLPSDIFELSYNLALYPPFHKMGAEFDKISVPRYDAFGVSTEMSDKTYLLVGNNSLQRAVDSINSQKTDTDVEISKMLVREKKNMQRKNGESQISLNQENSNLFQKNPQISEEKEFKNNNSPSQIDAAENRVSGFIRSVVENNSTPK
ncbi:MAG: hypothetical protein KGP29_04760 [Proteobacteria bacterium]|nr:hypothetical protein [Pseudomonadota bacterium]